ncbi:PrsW family intramembrane metalloprotease, partial [Gordonia rhizosphera]
MSAPDSMARRLEAIEESGWGRPIRLVQPRNLAFWIYVVFVAIGIFSFATKLADLPSAYTTAIVAALLVWAVYTVPWVIFLHVTDRYEREPAKLAVWGFIWGGFAATWAIAIHGNNALHDLYATLISPEFALNFAPPLSAPLVEESSKAVGFVLILVLARHAVRSAFDGLIIGAFIGLGFQVLENIHYALAAAETAFGSANISGVIGTIVGRGLITGLFTHVLFSALVCAGLVYLIGTPSEPRNVTRGLLLVCGGVIGHG